MYQYNSGLRQSGQHATFIADLQPQAYQLIVPHMKPYMVAFLKLDIYDDLAVMPTSTFHLFREPRRSSETAQICALCWDMYTIRPRSGESGTSIQEETGEQSNAQVWYYKSKKTRLENLWKNQQKELSFQKLQPN